MKFSLIAALVAVTYGHTWAIKNHPDHGYKVSGDQAKHNRNKKSREGLEKKMSVKEVLKKFDLDRDGVVSHDEAEKKYAKYCNRFAMKRKNYIAPLKIKKEDRQHLLDEAADMCQDEFNMWWHDVDPRGEGFINAEAMKAKGPLEFSIYYEKLVA